MDRWLLFGTAGVAFSKGEVRNHDFCNTVPPCGGGLIDPEIFRFSASDTDFNIVRVGLNYKFVRAAEFTESLK